jgi:two-component system response regulator HydG
VNGEPDNRFQFLKKAPAMNSKFLNKKQTNHILIVEDDASHRIMLRTLLTGWGYAVIEAEDGGEAVQMVQAGPFDLILMDIRMLKVSGLEALHRIKTINPAIPVIIMTAYASVETALTALKNGAYDYLIKPLDFDELRLTMERAMEHHVLRQENRQLRLSLSSQFSYRNMIGRSPVMVRLLETIEQVAPSDATVLISGESGTGKELVAGAIHYNSLRKDGPFIKVNCAALTETLLESELFGHEKGAFTGAIRRKEGRIFQAHHGTLFLDEISEMSAAMQVKLLRVLQEREITRVGGEEMIKVDVRILAATNKDLLQEIRVGRFRADLFYRLNVVHLELPPLRERSEDIPLLAVHFLKTFSSKNNKKIKGFTPQAMDGLIKYHWPGNVRELMNVVERAVVLSQAEYLDLTEMPLIPKQDPSQPVQPQENRHVELPLDEVEKAAIIKTLDNVQGNKSEAARRLGITRRTLHKKLKEYGRMP